MRSLGLKRCCVVWLVLLHTLFVVWSDAGTCLAADVDIDEVLSKMSTEGRKFDSEVLRKEGVNGLSRLLDKLFPQTAKQPGTSLSKDEVARIVRQLGDKNFRVRQNATLWLTDKAEVFRRPVEQAAQDPDPEIRGRAKSIIEAWDAQFKFSMQVDVGIYADAFSAYLNGITDKAMLSELAQRTRLILETELKPKGQQQLLSHCLSAIAKSGNDQITDHLTPLLKHKDEEIVVWVTRTIGSHSGNRYFPRMLLEALKSDRERVVDTALSWTPNCWDRNKSGEVKRLVAKVFEGDNEKLKFHACFPMMHNYGDRRAIDYLLSQTKSSDKARVDRAISWIGDSCNSGKKAFPKLLEHLVPLLKSENKALRRRVADALGTYKGPEVVDALLPLLGDQEDIIQRETSRNLLNQRDKTMLKTRLADAVQNAKSETVREKAKELLVKLTVGR